MKLSEAALDYALRGYAVFPCGDDKAPLVEGGFKSASRDESQVVGWWGLFPDALIGLAIPEGFVIVDCDPRNGGDESLAALIRANGTWGTTRKAKTRSGGFHYWLRADVPEGARFRKELSRGVDVKVPGKGYIIAPPSPGYEWLDEGDVADAPAWLLDLVVKPEGEGAKVADVASEPRYFPFEEGTRYGIAARDRELARLMAAQSGTRNNALNTCTFVLAQLAAGGELSPDATLDAIQTVAERIGLEPDETVTTMRSAWDAGQAEPRSAPEQNTIGTMDGVEIRTDPRLRHNDVVPASDHFWTDWQVDEPPPPFYLDPLLPKNAYVLVYGATEASKSMAWMALLAQGSHEGVRSSFYSLENPRHVDRDRLRRLAPDPCCFRVTHEPLDLGWKEQVESLIEREREWGTNVIAIDTYSHAFNSRQSDDGNARAISFAQSIRHVMHELNDQGLSVVVVDHTGFPKEGEVKEPRDASAKRQQVDVAVYMEKDGEWQPGSDRAGFVMRNYKAARFGNPFNVRGAIRGRKGEPLRLEWESADFAGRWSA